MFARRVRCLLDMGALSNPPPEVVQGQRGTLVNILRFGAFCVIFDVQKMLQFCRNREETSVN